MAQSKEQKLWQACTDGDLETVRELADDPAIDINWVGEDRGDTPFHRVSRFGHLEIAMVLLVQERIEVNKGNKGDASPFILRVRKATRRWFPCCWLIQELIPTSWPILDLLPSSWHVRMATRRWFRCCWQI